MNKKIFTLLFLFASFSVSSQEIKDAGLWLSLKLEKNINQKLSVDISEEIRFNENVTELGTIFTEVGGTYKFTDWFRLGGAYRFSNRKRLDDSYSTRHRYNIDLATRMKKEAYSLIYRTRFQSQYRDINSSEDGSVPEYYNRHKLTLRFTPGNILRPYISGETYHRLYGDSPYMLDNIRFVAGTEVEINKHSTVDLFFLHQREVNVNRPDHDYIIGLGYVHTFE